MQYEQSEAFIWDVRLWGRIMSTGDASPGKTAPHLASSIDTL
jgi:hypothetical protein